MRSSFSSAKMGRQRQRASSGKESNNPAMKSISLLLFRYVIEDGIQRTLLPLRRWQGANALPSCIPQVWQRRNEGISFFGDRWGLKISQGRSSNRMAEATVVKDPCKFPLPLRRGFVSEPTPYNMLPLLSCFSTENKTHACSSLLLWSR